MNKLDMEDALVIFFLGMTCLALLWQPVPDRNDQLVGMIIGGFLGYLTKRAKDMIFPPKDPPPTPPRPDLDIPDFPNE